MLERIPAWHVPHEWAEIRRVLAAAIARDPKRDSWAVLDQAMSCDLNFWRVPGRGFVVTETRPPTFWIIYAGGLGGTMADKHSLMAELEQKGRDARCTEVKFEGRDWRKVFPDYSARRAPDGRWHFRKQVV